MFTDKNYLCPSCAASLRFSYEIRFRQGMFYCDNDNCKVRTVVILLRKSLTPQ